MIRKMLIGAALLVVAAATPAAAQTYDGNVSPGTVVAGQTVTISGSGCSPHDSITVTMTEAAPQRAVGDVIVTATTTANENGEFTYTITVPVGTPVGTYEVTATCGNGAVFSGFVDVVAPTTPTTAPGGGTGPIVRTGSDLNGLGLAGAALITVGGIVLIATRSRRHANA